MRERKSDRDARELREIAKTLRASGKNDEAKSLEEKADRLQRIDAKASERTTKAHDGTTVKVGDTVWELNWYGADLDGREILGISPQGKIAVSKSWRSDKLDFSKELYRGKGHYVNNDVVFHKKDDAWDALFDRLEGQRRSYVEQLTEIDNKIVRAKERREEAIRGTSSPEIE